MPDYSEVADEARKKNEYAREAINAVRTRTEQMRSDQQSILTQNKIENEDLLNDVSGIYFASGVKQHLAEELERIKICDAGIKSSTLQALPQLKTSRMQFILEKTLQYYGDDESVVCRLLEGKMPNVTEYPLDAYLNNLPALGTSEFWGNNAATIFNSALLGVNFVARGHTIEDYMHTSIAHVIPVSGLPDDYTGLENNNRKGGGYNYAYIGANGITGYGVVHAGFAFGGSRQEFGMEPKRFAPEDASSAVAKWVYTDTFSTQDLLCMYRSITKEGTVGEGWPSNPARQSIECRFNEVVKPENVQAGDVYFTRTFNPSKGPSENLGSGGWTGIVLDKDPHAPGKAILIGFNRDMERQKFVAPNSEENVWGFAGAGVVSRSMVDEENTKVFFIRPKPRNG